MAGGLGGGREAGQLTGSRQAGKRVGGRLQGGGRAGGNAGGAAADGRTGRWQGGCGGEGGLRMAFGGTCHLPPRNGPHKI